MQTASEIANQIRTSLDMAAPFRQIWEVCIEFTRGNQEPGLAVGGVNANGSNIANRIWQPENIAINKILPIRNNVASRLATAYPSMTVMPASDSVDDEMKMKASQLALRYYWNEDKIKRKLKKGTQWLTDCGNYALHEYFDEVTGDVTTEVITPFDIVYEPYVSDSKDAEWVAIRRFTTKEAIELRFPDEVKEIEELAETAKSQDAYRQIGPQAHARDRIEIWEVYTLDGRHMLMLGHNVLWEGRTQTKAPPVQHIRYTEISGYLMGVGLVEVCLSTQIMRNRFMTQIMKNAYLVGNPKIMIPVESGVEADAFAADAGEKIPFIGGHAPTPWNAPPMPDYLVNLPSRLDSDMQDAANMNAVAMGKMSSAKSGVAIDALTANNLSPLQLVQENIEEGVTDMACCVLQLMQRHYTEKKMIRMMDTNGSFVFRELKSTDLVEDPQIFLEAGSLFRSEANDRDEKTLNYLKAGLITPDQAKMNLSTHAVSLDMVEKMAGLRRAKDLLAACVTFNRPLEGLTPVDDLEALKDVWSEFMHSPDFYRLPLPKQDMVDNTYQNIVQMIMQKAQMAAGIAPQGAPQAPQAPQAPNAGLVAPGNDQFPVPPPEPAMSVKGQQAGSAQFQAPEVGGTPNGAQ